MPFFLISSMVLGLLVQLQIFLQYLIELLGLLTNCGATLALTVDICKAFDRVWYVGLLHKLKSYWISGQIFSLISYFLSNRQLEVVVDGNSSQEYPVNAGVLKAPFLVLHFSYNTLMTFLKVLSVRLLSMLMIPVTYSEIFWAYLYLQSKSS